MAEIEMIDLGMSPLCESYLTTEQLGNPEVFYPLTVMVCSGCHLAQLDEFATPDEIFTEYAYFSSYSDSWLDHCRRYAHDMTQRLDLGPASQVVEVASNDGYLLRWFVQAGIPSLGIEPAANVAEAAREIGVRTEVAFFGRSVAAQLRSEGLEADLLIGNNVLAQVPDLHDFLGGFKTLLAPGGAITLEFPHLLQLLEQNQFDTIYHEHFSYFSLLACLDIFARHELEIFDVDELTTHGGSLRIHLQHAGSGPHEISDRVTTLIEVERRAGLEDPKTYQSFGARAEKVKHELLSTLIEYRSRGDSIVGYGAAGKGNTLLNFAGIRTDFLEFIADRNPYKIGRYTPGTHIPIVAPSEIRARQPRHILILPWNLRAEIEQQLAYVQEWGADFIVPIPSVTTNASVGSR